jgi:hypothetical protein
MITPNTDIGKSLGLSVPRQSVQTFPDRDRRSTLKGSLLPAQRIQTGRIACHVCLMFIDWRLAI